MSGETKIGTVSVEASLDTTGLKQQGAEGSKAIEGLAKSAAGLSQNIGPAEKSIQRLTDQITRLGPAAAQDKLDRLAQAVERAGGAANMSGGQIEFLRGRIEKLHEAGAKIPGNLQEISKHSEGLTGKLQELGKEGFGELSGELGPLSGLLEAIGPLGIAAGVGIGALAAGGEIALELADDFGKTFNALENLHVVSGLAVGTLASWNDTAKVTGVGAESLNTAMQKLAMNIEHGNQATIDAATALGIPFEELKRAAPEERLRLISEGIQGIGTDSDAAQAAVKGLFGKGGLAILPALTSEAIEYRETVHGVVETIIGDEDDAAEAGKRWAEQQNLVGVAYESLKLRAGGAIAQAVEDLGTLGAAAVKVQLGIKDDAEAANIFKIAIKGALDQITGSAALGTLHQIAEQLRPVETPDLPKNAPKPPSGEPAQIQVEAPEAAEVASRSARGPEKHIAEMKAQAEEARRQFHESMAAFAREDKAAAADAERASEFLEKQAEKASKAWHLSIEDQTKAFTSKIISNSKIGADADKWAQTLANQSLPEVDRVIAEINERAAEMKGHIQDGVPGAEQLKDKIDAVAAAAAKAAREAAGIKGQLAAGLANLPNVILGAIQGGGNVMQAIGGSLGGDLGKGIANDLGKTLASSLGKTLGSAVGSAIPIIGTLAGGLVGKLIGGLFGPSEASQVRKMRDEWVASAGGLAAIQKEAKAAGFDLTKLFHTGKIKDFQAELQKLKDALDAQKESEKAVDEAAQRYGLTIDELGPKFKQQKLDEQAGQILQDFDLLKASGADMTAVIAKMAPSINDYVNESLKAGTAIPENMRPILEAMLAAGQLTDSAGNKLTDLSGINFTKSLTDEFQTLIDKIGDLVAALTGIPKEIDTNVNVNTNTNTNSGDYHQQQGQQQQQQHQHAADGFRGLITMPTTFSVAERGPELVDVRRPSYTPLPQLGTSGFSAPSLPGGSATQASSTQITAAIGGLHDRLARIESIQSNQHYSTARAMRDALLQAGMGGR